MPCKVGLGGVGRVSTGGRAVGAWLHVEERLPEAGRRMLRLTFLTILYQIW
jgi:hypothetical protein